MGKFNKLIIGIIGIIAVLLVNVLSPFGSLVANASTVTTDVTIHKITGSEELEGTWEALTGTQPDRHNDGTPIPNIAFTYFKVDKENYDQLMSNMSYYDNAGTVQELVGSGGIETGLTDRAGQVTVTGLDEGYYYFVENGSTAVQSSHAVPFGLELPFTNKEGTGYIKDLHVWPKNTLEGLPTIDKTVEDLTTKSNSYDIGNDFVWNIQTTVPKGINEYKVYRITDELDDALDFNGQSVKLSYGDTQLVLSEDYTLNYDNHTIVIDLTKNGLEKLGGLLNPDTQLVTEITTQINENAVLGLPIVNDAQLDFDNNHGNTTIPGEDGTPPTEEPPTVEEPPKVYTGGKKFIKVDTEGTKLEGAEFVIKNADGQFLKQDAHRISWISDQIEATVFSSNSDGTFEVKGLSYGAKDENNQGSSDYILVETKAPEGYALPTNPETSFTVNASSYYSTPTELIPAGAMEIINRKVIIPQTGGSGTILFTVIGLLLMVSAFVMIRKKKEVVQ